MKPPYTITDLNALMHACVSFTKVHEPDFWAGNISGRDGVSTDIPSVERMMEWVVETDKGLLESLGFGKDNVVYFRLGHDAERIMNEGGFEKYLRSKTLRERLEGVRRWASIGISFFALIVSTLVWQAPKNTSSRIDDLTAQVNGLRNEQEQIKAMVASTRSSLDTTSSAFPTATTPTNGGDHFTVTAPAAPDRIPGVLDQPWLLVASVAMLSISFFLLHQAVGLQGWATAKDETAPRPGAGVGLTWTLSIAIIAFSFLYWIVHHPHPPNLKGPEAFLWFISNRPSELAPGPLLGSIVPAVMAIFKFVTAGFIMRGNAQELPPLARSPTAALAGASFALISLAGSLATLIMFFFWVKNP
jgi:hypothetical protein